MKRLIAKRKLKRTCNYCGKQFKKGEIYYKPREVFEDGNNITAYEYLICSKCKYEKTQSLIRFLEFQKHCTHPYKFIETVWKYIHGECVKEPGYDLCTLCGEVLGGQ